MSSLAFPNDALEGRRPPLPLGGMAGYFKVVGRSKLDSMAKFQFNKVVRKVHRIYK